MKEIEEDDQEFERLLEDKRHNELIKTIKLLVTEINNSSKNDGLVSAIKQQTDTVKRVVDEVRQILNKEVKVETNQDKVIVSIDAMKNSVIKGLDKISEEVSKEIESPKKQWEFIVQRDNNGYIKSVTAKERD